MNSLSFLSRQLDASASRSNSLSKVASSSSTPSSPSGSTSTPDLARSKTWSKPFFFRQRRRRAIFILRDSEDDEEDEEESDDCIVRERARERRERKQRSFSSPALFASSVSQTPTSTSDRFPVPPPPPTAPSIPLLLPSPLSHPDSLIILKQSHLYRRFHSLYLVRALVAVWNSLYATYQSIVLLNPHHRQQQSQQILKPRHLAQFEEQESSTSADEDDEAEMIHMSPVTRAHVPSKLDREHQHELLAPAFEFTPPNTAPPSYASISHESSAAANASQSDQFAISLQMSTAYSTPSPTPPLSTFRRSTPFQKQKTLVLDLDETLIHSASRALHHNSGAGGLFGFEFGGKRIGPGHTVEVHLNGRRTLYHVYKRPFVDYFLRKVSTWYTLVIFTASIQEYADPVIDWLDAGKGILGRRFFRDSCTPLPSGSYTKDLSLIEEDLSRVCLVDNSPICYSGNPANGIPIEGWTHDLSDEALLDLLPVLDSLRFTSDVRRVLGLRGFS